MAGGGGRGIDRPVGDDVMAIFRDPRRAVRASIELQPELFRPATEIDGPRVGVGPFEGPVVKGDTGSEATRNHTVMGDSVNTASRLQSAARGGEVPMPLGMARKPELSVGLVTEPREHIALKGTRSPLEVVSVKSYRPPGAARDYRGDSEP